MPHEPRAVATSAARTANGNAALSMRRDYGSQVSVTLSVTAVSGSTPTLDVEVQWSHNGTTWASAQPADGFTQITGVSTVVKTFPIRAPLARVVWTIGGGTPSFTFTVDAYAV